jgi:N-acetylmuramic acid 6-phosphate etherase
MSTEDFDARFSEIDAWPLGHAIEAMWEGQMSAAAAVHEALPAVTAAAEAASDALCGQGRLVYVGAGTSARLAVQDGAELTPTFNWPRTRVLAVIAGGDKALTASVEGAEDDVAEAERRIDRERIGQGDVVIAVAASGTTPFTVAAVRRARRRGAITIAIANNPSTPLLAAAEHPILVATGGELVAGSTRMKAGTAQKIVLNLLSTAIMLKLGRVYRGMMVDMTIANAKLAQRAERMVARIAGTSEVAARRALRDSRGNLKLAALVASGLSIAEAKRALSASQGNLRTAFAMLPAPDPTAKQREPVSALPTQTRVERIAEHVTEKVQGKRQHENGKSGKNRAPRRQKKKVSPLRQHGPERRRGRLRTKPKKRQ